ncbi:fructokinase [Salix suchowensis]|nr:fructokinase [Salix suchowensis]
MMLMMFMVHWMNLSFSHMLFTVRSAHLQAMKVAKDADALLSYDPNLRLPLWPSEEEACEQIMSIWDEADVIEVSDNELQFLTGSDKIDDETAMLLWRRNFMLLLVALGEKGCNYYTKWSNKHAVALIKKSHKCWQNYWLRSSDRSKDINSLVFHKSLSVKDEEDEYEVLGGKTKVTIFYGTQAGTTECFAKAFAEEVKQDMRKQLL